MCERSELQTYTTHSLLVNICYALLLESRKQPSPDSVVRTRWKGTISCMSKHCDLYRDVQRKLNEHISYNSIIEVPKEGPKSYINTNVIRSFQNVFNLKFSQRINDTFVTGKISIFVTWNITMWYVNSFLAKGDLNIPINVTSSRET